MLLIEGRGVGVWFEVGVKVQDGHSGFGVWGWLQTRVDEILVVPVFRVCSRGDNLRARRGEQRALPRKALFCAPPRARRLIAAGQPQRIFLEQS